MVPKTVENYLRPICMLKHKTYNHMVFPHWFGYFLFVFILWCYQRLHLGNDYVTHVWQVGLRRVSGLLLVFNRGTGCIARCSATFSSVPGCHRAHCIGRHISLRPLRDKIARFVSGSSNDACIARFICALVGQDSSGSFPFNCLDCVAASGVLFPQLFARMFQVLL